MLIDCEIDYIKFSKKVDFADLKDLWTDFG